MSKNKVSRIAELSRMLAHAQMQIGLLEMSLAQISDELTYKPDDFKLLPKCADRLDDSCCYLRSAADYIREATRILNTRQKREQPSNSKENV